MAHLTDNPSLLDESSSDSSDNEIYSGDVEKADLPGTSECESASSSDEEDSEAHRGNYSSRVLGVLGAATRSKFAKNKKWLILQVGVFIFFIFALCISCFCCRCSCCMGAVTVGPGASSQTRVNQGFSVLHRDSAVTGLPSSDSGSARFASSKRHPSTQKPT